MKKVVTFASAIEKNRSPAHLRKTSCEKKSEKVFGRLKNLTYLCNPFRPIRERGLEKEKRYEPSGFSSLNYCEKLNDNL
ncbi:hypothetical protein [uncultured Rikenella sp.]|uniref:hypothetical protein n=1 Tax=uncultured Rikenella sp. TaxID=368003 RepID=UPI0025EEF564|nr:hypothetical protein [uncultured Rikenella sp.]